jgi:hypothetical protein
VTVVYLLIPKGNYLHDPLGVFSTKELADRALVRAIQSNDGYHRILIHPMELDAWQLRAFDRLRYDKTRGTAPPSHATDGLAQAHPAAES